MSIEKTGRTVEEALAAALSELNLTEADVDVQVLQEAKNGFFGIGKRDARILVTPKAVPSPMGETADAPTAAPTDETVQAVVTAAAAEAAPAEKPAAVPSVDDAQAAFAERVKEKVDAELGAAPAPRRDRDRQGETPFVVDEHVVDAAKEFLQKVFQAMDMQVVMEKFINKKDGCVVLKLHGADMGVLIGKHGQTLDAFQYLTNLVANKNSETRVHIVIDVENYRERRAETLTRLARRLADKCKRTGERVVLEPMNPHERKIIHTALQGDPRVTTLSEGSEPFRKVVIELKK